MDATIGQPADKITASDPTQRSAALADARRRASQAALKNADASETRKADQREMLRGIIERAVGANTRLSIRRNDAVDTFVYQAIDKDSGEIVKEWPPVQFAKFLEENGVAANDAAKALSGLVVDEQA